MIGTILVGCLIIAALYITYRMIGRKFVHEYKLHNHVLTGISDAWHIFDPNLQVMRVEKVDGYLKSHEYVFFNVKYVGRFAAVYDCSKDFYEAIYFYDDVVGNYVRVM